MHFSIERYGDNHDQSPINVDTSTDNPFVTTFDQPSVPSSAGPTLNDCSIPQSTGPFNLQPPSYEEGNITKKYL